MPSNTQQISNFYCIVLSKAVFKLLWRFQIDWAFQWAAISAWKLAIFEKNEHFCNRITLYFLLLLKWLLCAFLLINFSDFFTNSTNVMAAHTLTFILKSNHIWIPQKMGVVIFTCYYMIILYQNHFLEHACIIISSTKMVKRNRHCKHCHTQEISDQTDEK